MYKISGTRCGQKAWVTATETWGPRQGPALEEWSAPHSLLSPAIVISCHCSLSSLYFSHFYTLGFLFPYCVPPILLDVPALPPTISSVVAVMPVPSSRLSNAAQICQNLHCHSLFPFRMKCSPFSSIPLACAFRIWHLSPISISPISCYFWCSVSNTWTITIFHKLLFPIFFSL